MSGDDAAAEPVPAASPQLHGAEGPPNDISDCLGITVIGKSLVIKGDLSGSEDLFVDGEVDGSIMLHGQRLTVRAHGRVRANIDAGVVMVHGRVEGNIQARHRRIA